MTLNDNGSRKMTNGTHGKVPADVLAWSESRDHLTVTEACKRLRIAPRTLMRWIGMGKVKSVRPGWRHLIPMSEIKHLMQYNDAFL